MRLKHQEITSLSRGYIYIYIYIDEYFSSKVIHDIAAAFPLTYFPDLIIASTSSIKEVYDPMT
jgi:hypothetical protein